MKTQLLFQTFFVLEFLLYVESSISKRILVDDNFYTLVNKLNELEKEVATLKANTVTNNTLQELLKTQQAKQTTAVAFMAYLTTHERGTNHHIYFDDVKTNIGNAYNPLHGMFVAPVDGIYQFSVTACSTAAHYIVLEINVNNSMLGKVIAGDDAYADCNSKAFVVKLALGDNVFIQHRTEGEYLFSDTAFGLPTFSGFLIKAL